MRADEATVSDITRALSGQVHLTHAVVDGAAGGSSQHTAQMGGFTNDISLHHQVLERSSEVGEQALVFLLGSISQRDAVALAIERSGIVTCAGTHELGVSAIVDIVHQLCAQQYALVHIACIGCQILGGGEQTGAVLILLQIVYHRRLIGTDTKVADLNGARSRVTKVEAQLVAGFSPVETVH